MKDNVRIKRNKNNTSGAKKSNNKQSINKAKSNLGDDINNDLSKNKKKSYEENHINKPKSINKNNKQGYNKDTQEQGVKYIYISIGVLITIFIFIYMGIGLIYYNNKFLPGTSINGQDFSSKTVEVYKQKLNEDISKYTFNIINDGEIIDLINNDDISLSVDSDIDTVARLLMDNQNKITWPIGFFKEVENIEIHDLAMFDEGKLDDIIYSSKGYNLPTTYTSQPARLIYNEGEFDLIAPTLGDQIDKEAYIQRVKEHISRLKSDMVIQNADVYLKADFDTLDDEVILQAKEKASSILDGVNLKIRFGFDNSDITNDIITAVVKFDENTGDVVCDDTTIDAYMTHLKKKYNNIGLARKFKTGHGTEVEVKGGDYGCYLDVDSLSTYIKDAIFNKVPIDKTINLKRNVLTGTGVDVGSTYVEIDLTNQYLFVFKDGKKVYECPVVTGLPGERYTPQGTYILKNKIMDVPLVGADYVTPVKYWMPFNGGIGLHDAVWQSKLGGETYKKKGSHGCVNLMMSSAQQIYSLIEVNTPIVCYYHDRISSYQPVNSTGKVMSTYRPLTDNEKRMLANIRAGRSYGDNGVRDSNVGVVESTTEPLNNDTQLTTIATETKPNKTEHTTSTQVTTTKQNTTEVVTNKSEDITKETIKETTNGATNEATNEVTKEATIIEEITVSEVPSSATNDKNEVIKEEIVNAPNNNENIVDNDTVSPDNN